MTLLLMGLLAVVGYVGFSALRESTAGVASGPLLAAGQLEARRFTDVAGEFPADVVDALLAVSDSSLGFSAGPASGSVVSVYRIDESSLVLAAVSGPDCLVLLDRPAADATWALFRGESDGCSASALAAQVVTLSAGGSPTSPQEVTGA